MVVQTVTKNNLGSWFDTLGLIEAGKINPALPTNEIIPVGYIPTTTGNVLNRNSFVIDINSDVWFIDYAGDAIKMSPALPAPITVTDNVSGTVTVNAGVGQVQDTIRPINELTALSGSVDSTLDKIPLWDASTSNHVYVSPSQVGVFPNVRFGTTVPTVLGTDKKGDEYLVTSSGTNSTPATATYVFDGTVWNIRPVGSTVTVTDNTNGNLTINAGVGQIQDAIRPISELTTKSTSPDDLLDFIPIYVGLTGNTLKINKQTLVQSQVLYNAGALSGVVPVGKELGVDTTTGNFYYKNSSGNWQLQPVGTTVNLIDNADGTLTINASLGGIQKSIRPIDELALLSGSVDSALDKIPLWDASTSNHVYVSPSQVGVVPNVRFGTTPPTVLGTDKKGDEYLITSSGTNSTAATATYVFDGTAWNIRPAGGSVQTEFSVQGDGSAGNKVKLVNDLASAGNYKVYGTNSTGVKGWQSAAVSVTVGQIQAFATTVIPQGYKLLNGQTLTGGVVQYPILAGMYPTWVSGADIILPNLSGSSTDGGYFLRSASSTRAVNTFQADAFKSHNHQGGDTVANNGDRVLAQVSSGGSNTSTATDVTAGELNLLNGYTMIPMEGGTETRPVNYTVWYAVATDEVLQPMASTLNVTVNQAISPIKDWTANTNFTTGDIVYNAPYLYRRNTTGNSGATFAGDVSNYTQISPQSNVYTQTGNPNLAPIATAIKGDHCVVTSDGTTTGVIQTSWVYNGTTWVKIADQATAVAVSTGFRTYYPVTTALQELWTTIRTAADITNYGFTAVGGATITPYGVAYDSYWMLSANATRATTTTNYTIPSSYIRHELPITPIFDNTYFLSTLKDRETTVEVWVCDPTTGVPVKRLAANATSSIAAGRPHTTQLSPQDGTGANTNYYEWVGFNIPAATVTTYKTGTNTIKLALRPAINNGEGTLFYIGGFAMAKSDYGLGSYSLMVYDDWLNENLFTTAQQWVYAGVHENRSYGTLAFNATMTLRVPLTSTTRDIILNFVTNAQSGMGTGEGAFVDFTIKHASGDVLLGKPKPIIKCPSANATLRYGHNAFGFLIPAAILAAKSVIPTNSAVSYLEMQMKCTGQQMTGSGFVIEYAS